MNGVPRSGREEMVAELEALGYDTMPGVREDWADWRERLSDVQLQVIVRNVAAAIDRGEQVFSDAGAVDAVAADIADGFPDILEMVDAMRGLVAASRTWFALNPPFLSTDVQCDEWDRAIKRLTDLVDRIDAASADAFGASDA